MQTPKRSRSEIFRNRIDRWARNSPAQLAITVFASIVLTITGLLCLPWATATGKRAPFVDALFNATSAVCVTGLVTVDTATYWSTFGHAVLAVGIKVGGLGVMTLASIMALAVSRHIGLTQRMLAASEKQTDQLGEVGSLIKAVLIASSTIEILLFSALFPRFLTLGLDAPVAAWRALFMSVSIYNNAGFVIMPEGLGPYIGDWWMVMPIIVGTASGAIGFPVVLDVAARWRTPERWSLHTKLTLTTYGILIIVGAVLIGAAEWSNPNTYGKMDMSARILSSLLMGINSRSCGLSTVDVGQMTGASWFLQDMLMFIGGGSASTGGGIKVTTLAVMTLAIVAEARGDRDIEAFGRRIPHSVVRLAVAVAAMGAFLVASGTLILLSVTDFTLDVLIYDAISAFGTVGLSTGITPDLPPAGKYVLTALMFAGRTGTMTVAAALALRERRRVIRLPEDRPAIG